MTQKTLDKMNRAMKALDIARHSFVNDALLCRNQEERMAFSRDYEKFIDLEQSLREIIGKAETEIFLKNQKSVEEMLEVQG